MASGHAADLPDVLRHRPLWLASLRSSQGQLFLLGHELLECGDVEGGVRVIEVAARGRCAPGAGRRCGGDPPSGTVSQPTDIRDGALRRQSSASWKWAENGHLTGTAR